MVIEYCNCKGLRNGCMVCGGTGFRNPDTGRSEKYPPPAVKTNVFLGDGDERREYFLESREFGYDDRPRVDWSSAPAKKTKSFEQSYVRVPKSKRARFDTSLPFWRFQLVPTVTLSAQPPLPEMRFRGCERKSENGIKVVYLRKCKSSTSIDSCQIEPPRVLEPTVTKSILVRSMKSVELLPRVEPPVEPVIAKMKKATGLEILGSFINIKKTPTLYKQRWARR